MLKNFELKAESEIKNDSSLRTIGVVEFMPIVVKLTSSQQSSLNKLGKLCKTAVRNVALSIPFVMTSLTRKPIDRSSALEQRLIKTQRRGRCDIIQTDDSMA